MQLPYSEYLDIAPFSRLFDNKAECYKLFWFQAIVSGVLAGREEFSFEELINEMIGDAWYMVTEYHLNLGPRDTLEKIVQRLSSVSCLKPSEKKETLLRFLGECKDSEMVKMKRDLTLNVPFRLQAPFLKQMRGNAAWNVGIKEQIKRINQEKDLIYYFDTYDGLKTRIRVQGDWKNYIEKNGEIIRGWIELNMIQYLQRRNPNVPGIVDKLYPPQGRKLDKVQKYWRLIVSLQPTREIYQNTLLSEKDVSIDHFVPWSYVANDEFWNLHPTTKSMNSKKSNQLPEWNTYFPLLCQTEYRAYKLVQQYETVHKAFDKCAKEHLNSEEIHQRLYRSGQNREEFSSVLEQILQPVYTAAKNAGFREWKVGD